MIKHNYEKLFADRYTTGRSIVVTSSPSGSLLPGRKLSRVLSPTRRHIFRFSRRRLLFLAVLIFLVIISFTISSGFVCSSFMCHNSFSSQSSLSPLTSGSSYYTPGSSSVDDSDDYQGNSLESSPIDDILVSKFGYTFSTYETRKSLSQTLISYREIHDQNRPVSSFNISSNDVMVFLHMQKTGGSAFDRHLTRDLTVKCNCETKKKKKCRCWRPNSKQFWLFSRYSIGWKCGLHADYTVSGHLLLLPVFSPTNPTLSFPTSRN